jgi:hypothetical protein
MTAGGVDNSGTLDREAEHGERNGADARWWVILTGPVSEEQTEGLVDATSGVAARIVVSHAGVRLRHDAAGFLHCAIAEGSLAWACGKAVVAVLLGKDEEPGELGFIGVEVRWTGIGGTEIGPFVESGEDG